MFLAEIVASNHDAGKRPFRARVKPTETRRWQRAGTRRRTKEIILTAATRGRFVGLRERVLTDGSTECFAVYDEPGDADAPPAEHRDGAESAVTDKAG